jgi:hypothetical protein
MRMNSIRKEIYGGWNRKKYNSKSKTTKNSNKMMIKFDKTKN